MTRRLHASRSAALFIVMLALVFCPHSASSLTHLYPAVSEVDGDGIDNDGDGYTDSADTECGSHYVGYGSQTVGGAGKPVYWVDCTRPDTAADTNPGTFAAPCSLRKALAGGSRVIKFVNGGTITLTSGLTIRDSYITVDGFSAPAPGVTIAHNTSYGTFLISLRKGQDQHDTIINHIRFDGLWDIDPTHVVGRAIFSTDSDNPSGSLNTKIYNLVIDHCDIRDDQDKFTLWGWIERVTISNCFFYDSGKALLISFYSAPYNLLKTDITLYHNCLAENDERNPQLRNWIRNLDIVNNVIYHYAYSGIFNGGYGTRVKSEVGEEQIYANFINNYWYNKAANGGSSALIYGTNPGADSNDNGPSTVLPQGTVYTQSGMGELWVSGNILPPENMDQYSTISSARPTPDWAQVPTSPASQLYQTIGTVGMQYPDARAQAVMGRVLAAITPTSEMMNAALFYNSSAFDTVDDNDAIATDKQPLLPGQTAGFANYSSYSRGINGLVVDLPNAAGVDAADFTFQVGNSANLADWTAAPAPESVTVLTGQGVSGSDRVKIIWADGAIINTWLRITVKASAGIAADEVLYFGNCIGETGNGDPRVSPADQIAVRDNGTAAGGAGLSNACDFDRDAKVGPSDAIIARNHGNTAATTLQMITAP